MVFFCAFRKELKKDQSVAFQAESDLTINSVALDTGIAYDLENIGKGQPLFLESSVVNSGSGLFFKFFQY